MAFEKKLPTNLRAMQYGKRVVSRCNFNPSHSDLQREIDKFRKKGGEIKVVCVDQQTDVVNSDRALVSDFLSENQSNVSINHIKQY